MLWLDLDCERDRWFPPETPTAQDFVLIDRVPPPAVWISGCDVVEKLDVLWCAGVPDDGVMSIGDP